MDEGFDPDDEEEWYQTAFQDRQAFFQCLIRTQLCISLTFIIDKPIKFKKTTSLI